MTWRRLVPQVSGRRGPLPGTALTRLRTSLATAAVVVAGTACGVEDRGGAAGLEPGLSSGGMTNSGGVSSAAGAGATTGVGGGQAATSGGAAAAGGDTGAGGSTAAGGAENSGGAQSVEGSGGGSTATGGAENAGSAQGVGGSGDTGGSAGSSAVVGARQIATRGHIFDVLETGAGDDPVLLLHGFPETSLMWTNLLPKLSAGGYHCLAPDQRGYSPGARPVEVDAYRYAELVADAFALGSELGERFHVVGHDWGAIVGWLMLEADPSRVASMTAISIPHYAVWAKSVYDDPEMDWYHSMLDIWMTEGEGEDFWTPDRLRAMWTAKPADQVEQTIDHMMAPGAMTAALNWYRASRGHRSVLEELEIWSVSVPTLLIHGSADSGERSVAETEALMSGPYRVVRPKGGHFIVDEQPQEVAEAILAHLHAHPIE